MTEAEFAKETRVLSVFKRVFTDVAKDTMTPPGMKHPLSDDTLRGIRECLELITALEQEILAANGQTSELKPLFPDQLVKKAQSRVSVQFTRNKKDDTT